MPAKLTAGMKRLLEGKNFASIGTVMPDGSPQVTAVWVDHDGDAILVNTVAGRLKDRNLRRDPRVAISVYNQENPYETMFARGSVVEFIEHDQGANDHIDKLAKKYLGLDTYPYHQPGDRRVLYRIEVEHVKGPLE